MPWGGLFTDLEFAAFMTLLSVCLMARGMWLERRKELDRIVALCDQCKRPITAREKWYCRGNEMMSLCEDCYRGNSHVVGTTDGLR